MPHLARRLLDANREGDRRVLQFRTRFDVDEAARVRNATRAGDCGLVNLSLPDHLCCGERVAPWMAIHHLLARHIGQVDPFRSRRVADLGGPGLAYHVVVRRDPHQGMASLVTASKGWDLVAGPLEFLREDLPRRVHLCPIDEFDVCGPAPRRHQPIGRGSSVFVREDHRIAELPAPGRDDNFTPHQHGEVGKSTHGVGSRIHKRGEALRERRFVMRRHHLDVDPRNPRLARRWRGQGAIRLDDQMMRSGRDTADCDAVVAVLCTARQEQMLRILALERDSYRGRRPILFPPVASFTRRMHDRHGLTVGGTAKGLVEAGRRILTTDGGNARQYHSDSRDSQTHGFAPGYMRTYTAPMYVD